MKLSTQQIEKLKEERAENEAKIEQLTHQNERLRASIRRMFRELTQRIKEISAVLTASRERTLAEPVTDYYSDRNKGAWSHTARIGNLKSMSQMVNFLRTSELHTVADLDSRKNSLYAKLEEKENSGKTAESRMKEISELLRMVDIYQENKEIYDKWYNTKFTLTKNKLKADHEKEIRKFQMAARKLKPYFHAGKLPLTKWRNELAALEKEHEQRKAELNALKAEVRSLTQIAVAVDCALGDERKKEREAQRHHEAER